MFCKVERQLESAGHMIPASDDRYFDPCNSVNVNRSKHANFLFRDLLQAAMVQLVFPVLRLEHDMLTGLLGFMLRVTSCVLLLGFGGEV